MGRDRSARVSAVEQRGKPLRINSLATHVGVEAITVTPRAFTDDKAPSALTHDLATKFVAGLDSGITDLCEFITATKRWLLYTHRF